MIYFVESNLILKIYHIPETIEQAQTLVEQLNKYTLYDVPETTIRMVCESTKRGCTTTSIKMRKPQIVDLDLYYGQDFSLLHRALRDLLQIKDSTGITLFHEPPGTGKTNYLRYLINEIRDKGILCISSM